MATLPDTILMNFLRSLARVGWGMAAHAEILRFRVPGFPEAGAASAIPLPEGHGLLVVAMPTPAPDMAAAFKGYEDIALEHRTLLRHLESRGEAPRLLALVAEHWAQVVDAESEEVLGFAGSRAEVDSRILPLLTPVRSDGRPRALEVRRQPADHARELGEWTSIWSARLGPGCDLPPGLTHRFLETLHLARLAERFRLGPSVPSLLDFATATARHGSPARFLEERLTLLSDRWLLLQDLAPRQLASILRALHEKELLGPCLRSHGLLSRTKFTPEIFAEAFADEPLRKLSWRSALLDHSLRELEGIDAEDSPDWLGLRHEFPLDSLGLAVMLRRYEELVQGLAAAAQAQMARSEMGERPGLQLDLLGEAPAPGISPAEAPLVALRQSLRVRTTDPARASLARTILLATACRARTRFSTPDLPFPKVRIEVVREGTTGLAADTENLN